MDKLGNISQLHSPQAAPQKVLTMVKNERMGGYIPKWEAPKPSAQNAAEQSLNQAQNHHKQTPAANILAYHGDERASINAPSNTQEFTFGDMIDMVNPLHHIPLINHAYRSLSGDEIKPIGQVIGGALFGGPLGAATGLINVVIQEETGKDLTGNAMAMVRGEAPSFKTGNITPKDFHIADTSDQHVRRAPPPKNNAQQIMQEDKELSNALLSFSNLEQNPEITIKRVEKERAHDYSAINVSKNTAREPITQINLSKTSYNG